MYDKKKIKLSFIYKICIKNKQLNTLRLQVIVIHGNDISIIVNLINKVTLISKSNKITLISTCNKSQSNV